MNYFFRRWHRHSGFRLAAVSLAALSLCATEVDARELRVATLLTATTQTQRGSKGKTDAIAELNEALAREVCRRLAARCTLQSLPFPEIISGVIAENFQLGVGNVLRTPERETSLLFSQTLWRSSSRLVGTPQAIRQYRQGKDAEINLSALRNARVAVERGTQQHRYVSALAPERQLVIVEAATIENTLQQLLDGHADFALMPMRSAYFLLAKQPANTVNFTGPALTEQGLGGTVHIILPKTATRLLAEVDIALDAMRADGTFQRIIRRYMPFLAD
jgi:ABC-type amino acid transport substrate-binding protein